MTFILHLIQSLQRPSKPADAAFGQYKLESGMTLQCTRRTQLTHRLHGNTHVKNSLNQISPGRGAALWAGLILRLGESKGV